MNVSYTVARGLIDVFACLFLPNVLPVSGAARSDVVSSVNLALQSCATDVIFPDDTPSWRAALLAALQELTEKIGALAGERWPGDALIPQHQVVGKIRRWWKYHLYRHSSSGVVSVGDEGSLG